GLEAWLLRGTAGAHGRAAQGSSVRDVLLDEPATARARRPHDHGTRPCAGAAGLLSGEARRVRAPARGHALYADAVAGHVLPARELRRDLGPPRRRVRAQADDRARRGRHPDLGVLRGAAADAARALLL